MKFFKWTDLRFYSFLDNPKLQNTIWATGLCLNRTWGIAIFKRDKKEKRA